MNIVNAKQWKLYFFGITFVILNIIIAHAEISAQASAYKKDEDNIFANIEQGFTNETLTEQVSSNNAKNEAFTEQVSSNNSAINNKISSKCIASITLLNKISAKTIKIELQLNDIAIHDGLLLQLQKCHKTLDHAYAYVNIKQIQNSNEDIANASLEPKLQPSTQPNELNTQLDLQNSTGKKSKNIIEQNQNSSNYTGTTKSKNITEQNQNSRNYKGAAKSKNHTKANSNNVFSGWLVQNDISFSSILHDKYEVLLLEVVVNTP